MKVVVTGAAGFIGSHVVDALLAAKHSVVGIDNFSTGSPLFLASAGASPAFELVTLDLLSGGAELPALFEGAAAVIHLAANADVRHGLEAPRRDLEQNLLVTHNVLEGARLGRVARVLFSSTGSVYGETTVSPTPEDCPFPVQTSLYGASKVGCEGLISAYAEGFGITGTVFRFVSILGPRYTHGHVVDFIGQLLADPTHLTVLGDGSQRKSYLEVSDCVAAVVSMLERSGRFEVYNLGVDATCTVKESAQWIAERMGANPEVVYTGGRQGWVGDNPLIHLDCTKMAATGWSPRFDIQVSIERTVDYLLEHRWIVDRAMGQGVRP